MNPQATLVERDIRDGVDVGGAEVVFHLAAQTDVQTSMREPARDADVNVVGTVKVLEAAQRAGARVVFTSTGGAIYGECAEPATETTSREPGSPYGIAKLCGEEYLFGFNRIHGDDATSSRASGTSSGRVSRRRSRAAWCRSSSTGWRAATGRSSSATGCRSATSSSSATWSRRCSRPARTRAASSTSAAASPRPCSRCTRPARAAAGVPSEPAFEAARLGDLRRSALDVSRAATELGFRAQMSLDDGIARTWAVDEGGSGVTAKSTPLGRTAAHAP